MTGKRSEEALERRLPSSVRSVLLNVRKREKIVAEQAVHLRRREQLAPQVNERALLIAEEAAATCNMATKLAAHHLAEDVEAEAKELLASAQYCALARRSDVHRS